MRMRQNTSSRVLGVPFALPLVIIFIMFAKKTLGPKRLHKSQRLLSETVLLLSPFHLIHHCIAVEPKILLPKHRRVNGL
jgi:hypothetical protein